MSEYVQKECNTKNNGRLRSKGLLLTYNCNLDCTYCYIPVKSAKTMRLETAQEAIRSAFEPKNGMEYDKVEIQFMGAESLMAFDRLKEIAEWTWSQNWNKPYIMFATTNGTLLDDQMKQWFTDNKLRFVLSLSYDGTPHTQNINRSDSAEKIDLEFFRKNWPSQSIKMTISQQTVQNLAEGIIYLTEMGFPINANVAYEYEQWKTESINEYANQLSKLIDYYVENPLVGRASLLNMEVNNLLNNTSMVQNKYCGAGVDFDVTDVDGKQYPCHMFSPLVLIRSQLKRLNELDFQEQKNFADQRCEKCCLKNICPTCAGMNYNTTGNTELRDETHCKIFILEVMGNIKLQAKLIGMKNNNNLSLSKEEREAAVVIKQISGILNKNFGGKHNG